MKQTKAFLLFLAFLLPICIFLFLKFFGKNEFAVAPLYTDTYPEIATGCAPVTALPYQVPDSVMQKLAIGTDSLVVVTFGTPTTEGRNQLRRVTESFAADPVAFYKNTPDPSWKACTFFLKDTYDLVLVDAHATIRGQYNTADREDVDRLLTEIAIILKKY